MADIYTPKIKVDDNGSVQDLNLNAYAVQGKVPSTETTANTIVVRDGQGRVPIASSLQFPTAIPSGASLDDYRGDDKLGWYYTSGWSSSFPGSIDRATVLVCKNSNNEYMQVIYGIDDDISLICPYIRVYRNNQWTKWFTILDVTQGDIPSADAFKNIRTTLGVPDVSTFLKVSRQTNWVDNSILAGMESLYNPVLMFGSGDGQAFIAVNRVDHVVSVGGGTGKTYTWNEILATQKFVDDNYVSLAGGTIRGNVVVEGNAGNLTATSIHSKTNVETPRISSIDGANNYIEFYTKNDDGAPVLWGLRSTLSAVVFDIAKFIRSDGGTMNGSLSFSATGSSNTSNIKQDTDPNSALQIASYSKLRNVREFTIVQPGETNTWTHVQFRTSSFPYGRDIGIASEEWIAGQKGQANGIAPLNSEGKIDSTYLPPSEYVQKYAHHLTFKRIIEENDKIFTFITFTIVSTQKDKFTALTIEGIGLTLSNQGFNSQESILLAQGVRRTANATSNDYLNDYSSVFGVYGALVQRKWRTVCVAMENTSKVTTYSLLWSDFCSDVVVPL